MDSFDLVVIGAGPGGYVAAIRGAQKGLKTAVIENWEVGGTCLNRGCIPTKSMIHSAHLYREAKEGELFGVLGSGVGFDFDVINRRKIDVVENLRAGTEKLLKANKVKILRGKGKITAPGFVAVDTKDGLLEIEAKNIIIATGSKPKYLPDALQNLENVIDSDEALSLGAKFYKRILISGGGVIGVEFASIYNDLGCEVTIVGSRENLLRRLDPDISKNLMKIFTRRGIKIVTPARIKDIIKTQDGLVCQVSHKDVIKEITVDGVLNCIGRAPVIDCYDESLKIALDDGGFIITDENMLTNIPGIYSIGDCTSNSTQLAHAASAQGLNAVAHMTGEHPPANLKAIPNCVYTTPEIATVGLMESEAKERNLDIKVGKYIMTGNGKSIITNEDRGFMKLIFDAKSEILLGAHLMCARATDIISEAATAVANKMTAEQLISVIRPHPTYVEGLSEAAESIFGLAIHMENKR